MTARAAISSVGARTEAAGNRCRREYGEPGQQHALAAEPVTQVPRREDEGREDEVVCIDDPLELGCRGVQLPYERGQRDIHDRGVDVDREGRQQERAENQRLALHLCNRGTHAP
jgi:hypothetical protein